MHHKKQSCCFLQRSGPKSLKVLALNLLIFFCGCCLGRSRAVRPSVNEAKVKRDARAIISRLQCRFSKNMQGEITMPQANKGDEANEIKKGARMEWARGSPGKTLKGERSWRNILDRRREGREDGTWKAREIVKTINFFSLVAARARVRAVCSSVS